MLIGVDDDPFSLCYTHLQVGNRVHQQWLLAAASGGLQVLIFPTPGVYLLCWVALAPLFIALLRAPEVEILGPGGEKNSISLAQGFLVAYLSGIIWYAGSCYWVFHVMHVYGGLSAPVAGGILFLFCLYLALYHGLFGLLLVRVSRGSGGVARALLLAPFLWVAVELARARITGFPWDLLGTAQVNNIPLTRLATLTGVYGLSFVIVVVNTIFAAAFLLPRYRMRLAGVAVISAVALQLGSFSQPPASPTTNLALLVQPDIDILTAEQWTEERFDKTLATISQISRNPEAANASAPRLIIWPESPAPFYMNDPKLTGYLGALARDQQSYVLAGVVGLSASNQPGTAYKIYNSAELFGPGGYPMDRYDKVHLVPFGEYVPFKQLFSFAQKLTREVSDFSSGSKRKVMTLSATPEAPMSGMEHMQNTQPAVDSPSSQGHKLGVFICYESVFPDEVREFAAHGAELFVNISNDGWFGHSGAPGQHLNMARMRAIENHRWVLRATNSGITVSIDPYGRVVTRAPRDRQLSIAVPYSFETGTTFYTRHGDWFAWLCAIITLAALLIRFRLVFMRAAD